MSIINRLNITLSNFQAKNDKDLKAYMWITPLNTEYEGVTPKDLEKIRDVLREYYLMKNPPIDAPPPEIPQEETGNVVSLFEGRN